MGAPTVYYYDDAGAPVLTSGNDAFYQIVKACLIDGYGDKAAAGWSWVYDDWAGTGNASLTNAAGSGVLGIHRADTSGRPPFVYVCEGMVDAQTPVNARSGLSNVSGLSDFVEASGGDTLNATRTGSHWSQWCVIANDNFAMVFMGQSGMFNAQASALGGYSSVVAFGAIASVRGAGSVSAPLAGNFLIIGGASTDYVWRGYTPSLVGASVGNHSTAFYDMQGAVRQGDAGLLLWPFFQSVQDGVANGIGETDGSIQVMDLNRAFVVYTESITNPSRSGSQLGFIPGLYAVSYACGQDDSLDRALTGADLRDIVSDGGKSYLKGRFYGLVGLISLAAEDWS